MRQFKRFVTPVRLSLCTDILQSHIGKAKKAYKTICQIEKFRAIFLRDQSDALPPHRVATATNILYLVQDLEVDDVFQVTVEQGCLHAIWLDATQIRNRKKVRDKVPCVEVSVL